MSQSGPRAPHCVVWFRNDLRLADHTALTAATRSGLPIIACHVLDETTDEAPGAASRWWLHGSLTKLAADIEAHGGRLVLRRGAAAAAVARVATECGAVEVHCSKSHTPQGRRAEADLAKLLAAQGAKLVQHAGDVLFDPEQLRSQSGQPFKVFTPFWNACLRSGAIGAPLPVPPRLEFARADVASDSLASWELLPTAPDWAGGLRSAWQPGESGARARLAAFVAGPLRAYRTDRDLPDREGSSRLSPHLAFGEVSPRTVWSAVAGRHRGDNAAAFLRELGWREFARHLVWHWPHFPQASFRPEFRRFEWREDEGAFERWRRGQTGYPLVDAGIVGIVDHWTVE